MSTVEELRNTLDAIGMLDQKIRLSLLGPDVWYLYRVEQLHPSLLLEMHDAGPVRDAPARVRGAVSTLKALSVARSCEQVADYIDGQIARLSGADRFEFDMHEHKYGHRYARAFGLTHETRDATVIAKLATALINNEDEIYPHGFRESISTIWFQLCDDVLHLRNVLV